MVNDALKLTIDTVFKEKRIKNKTGDLPEQKSYDQVKYPVENYEDDDNMWDLLL